MGEYTRGGGAGRDPKHPGPLADAALAALRYEDRAVYERARREVEALLRRHLARAKAKSFIDRLTPQQQTDYLLSLFAGSIWYIAREKAARIVAEADKDTIARANALLPELFAEAANRTGYQLHRAFGGGTGGGGGTRGGGTGRLRTNTPHYDPLPYTAAIVATLSASGLIVIGGRSLNLRKDIAYIQKRIQSIVNAEALMHTAPTAMPGRIAHAIADSLQDATEATAQNMIFAAWDSGVYEAGIDFVRDGNEAEKTWLGIPDNRIRDSHRHLHNTTIPYTELFHGFYGTLRYPHDPKAPAAETMRCRCRLAIHIKGHGPVAYDGLLLPSQTDAYRQWRDDAIRAAGRDLLKQHERRQRRGDIRR